MSSQKTSSPFSERAAAALRYQAAQVDVYRLRVEMHAATLQFEADKYDRTLLRAQHPDWSEEMVSAHMELTRPPTLRFRRYAP